MQGWERLPKKGQLGNYFETTQPATNVPEAFHDATENAGEWGATRPPRALLLLGTLSGLGHARGKAAGIYKVDRCQEEGAPERNSPGGTTYRTPADHGQLLGQEPHAERVCFHSDSRQWPGGTAQCLGLCRGRRLTSIESRVKSLTGRQC